MIALVPEQAYGQTISATSQLLIYVPPTLGLNAEFSLYEASDYRPVVVKEFTLPEESGIIVINLATPDQRLTLEPGKSYEWDFVIPVDPNDRSGDAILQGSIERVEPAAELTATLARSANSERPFHLAQAGLWYDTVTALNDLRQAQPNNSQYATQWQQLLESVDLEYLADKPIIAEF
jgi:hypothetical protein